MKNTRKTTADIRSGRGDESRAAGLVASSTTTDIERTMPTVRLGGARD